MRLLKSMTIVFVTAVVILIGDFVWLSFATNAIYGLFMGDLLTKDIKLLPAVMFYILFVLGLYFLIVRPSLMAGHGHLQISLRSMGYGLCCYGTYDLSAWAVIEGWNWPISLIDMAWGSSIAGLAGFMASFASSLVNQKSI